MTHAESFRNVLVIAIIGVIIFGLFSFLNGNGKTQNSLHTLNLLISWIKAT